MRRIVSAFAIAVLVLGLAGGAAMADEEMGPRLAVNGEVATPSSLDLAAMQQLPVTTIDTSTIWTDGVTKFEGAAALDVLAAAGGATRGDTVKASAADGYAVEIPMAEFEKAIIAYKMNGELLTPDQFGPFWVIFDYDGANLNDEHHQGWSVYQLKSLEVK
jgi:hypothetical protein